MKPPRIIGDNEMVRPRKVEREQGGAGQPAVAGLDLRAIALLDHAPDRNAETHLAGSYPGQPFVLLRL